MILKHWALVGSCLALASVAGLSQTTTSNLVGTLTDQAGAVVPNVEVQLTDQATGSVRKVPSGGEGLFRFTNLVPAVYAVTVKASGFKTYNVRDINLAASETRDLGSIVLEVGTQTEEVQVTAQTTAVQTASSEKSALVDGTQLNTLALKGRDMFGFMKLIPGVVAEVSGDTTNTSSLGSVNINGGGNKNFTVDGVTNMDTGGNGSSHFEPNMDSIAEIRVLTANYQAEYGRNSSGTITVVTKSGGQNFHGSGWWNKRNEALNANDFFSNRTGTHRTVYRFDIFGFSVGGPVVIPKKFNTEKKRLFFFASQEYTKQKPPSSPSFANMPTIAERGGDFSNSRRADGSLIVVKDPTTGSPFPNNQIPKTSFNATGLAMLNFFPAPNYTESDPALRYSRNYKLQEAGTYNRRNDTIRIDTYLTSKLTGYYRFIHDSDNADSPGILPGFPGGPSVGPIQLLDTSDNTLKTMKTLQHLPGKGHAAGITYTINPTTVNEFLFGKSYNTRQTAIPEYPGMFVSSRMNNPPHFYDQAALQTLAQQVPLAYSTGIPGISFGSVPPGAVSLGMPTPGLNWNDIYSFMDNLTKVKGHHSFKAGVYIERTNKTENHGSNYRGLYDFSSASTFPLDSGDGFANALLGNYNSYTEGVKVIGSFWETTVEFFAQDSWRIGRRLTVDYGIRFTRLAAVDNQNQHSATFLPSAYSLAKAPRLYYPALVGGKRVAIDPITGITAPPSMIGLYVPNTGDPANGWQPLPESTLVPSTGYTLPGLLAAPRIGLAWDVFGNGKTAIRTGFGQFYNRNRQGTYEDLEPNRPKAYTLQSFSGGIDALGQAAGALGPGSSAVAHLGEEKIEYSMNGSFGVQQQLGWGTVLDVSYAGAFRRHGPWGRNINKIPLFSRFDPKNADPTNPSSPLPDNFFRPYLGQGDINMYGNGQSSNYNALQAQIRHQLSKSLSFGAAYTFSKTLGVLYPSQYFSDHWNYGPLSQDRRHVFAASYTYALPGAKLTSKALRAILGDWQISGITTFSTGAPFSPVLSTSPSVDLTGSTSGDWGALAPGGDTPRVVVVGDPNLPQSQRSFSQNFNTAAFALPPRCSWTNQTTACFGNVGLGILTGPGINNWDATLVRSFPIKERTAVRFRSEFYNALNHTQFSTVNSSAVFNPNTGAQTNPNFGAFTASRSPRIISFSLRFEF